ncbi:MAG: NTP transferase domain-containing protein [Thaumarchaeota archaeon]|nr:NTP transferase domain-containing protein [Nitrososphaerota archaeon]
MAAGEGSRLRPYSVEAPKCLMELEPGVRILDFILERVRGAGFRKIYVVVRAGRSQILRESVEGEDVEFIEVDLDSFENLYSVGVAARRIGGRFLVLMSDHIFERGLLEAVLERVEAAEEAFVVCLDMEPAVAEAEEGLKLRIEDGRIVETGKSLTPIYGIDTGLIYCNDSALKYIEKALEEKGPKASIKDALNLAAAEGEVGYVDVTGLLWKDIDTPEDLEKARELYWKILKRELIRPSDGWISRYLNRSISSTISIALYKRRIYVNPNLISLFSFLVSLVGAVLLGLHNLLLGGILVQASSIIDGMDGELARLFKKVSRFGAVLDSFLDRLADLAIIGGMVFAIWPLGLVQASAALLASANTILVSYVTHLLQGSGIDVSKIRRIPVTRDVRLFVVFAAALLGFIEAALYFLALAPFAYYVAGVALAWRSRQVESAQAPSSRRSPWPPIPRRFTPVKNALSELVGRVLKFIVIFLILKLLTPILSGFTLIEFGDTALTSTHVLLVLEMLVVIYFGYAIFSSVRKLADLIAFRLVSRVGATKETLRRIFLDLTYAILGLIAWVYATNLAEIPLIGETLSKMVMAAAAIFFFISLYRLGKRIYTVFADVYDRLMERLARKLSHEQA